MNPPKVTVKLDAPTSRELRVDDNGYVVLSNVDVERIADEVVGRLASMSGPEKEGEFEVASPPVAEGQEELFSVARNQPDRRLGYP